MKPIIALTSHLPICLPLFFNKNSLTLWYKKLYESHNVLTGFCSQTLTTFTITFINSPLKTDTDHIMPVQESMKLRAYASHDFFAQTLQWVSQDR